MSPALPFVFALSVFLLQPSVFSPQPAHAVFADLGAGARAPGMGNAFVAVADDVYSVHYNPAGLALLDRPELATSYTRYLMGLSDGSNLGMSFIGYAYPLTTGQGVVAASWQQFNLDGGLYQEQTFGISYGNVVLKGLGSGDLYGGINLKNLHRSFGSVPEANSAKDGLEATGRADPVLSGNRSLNAPDIDLGFLYRLRKHYAAGLALTHITRPNVAFSRSDSDLLPLGVKAGFNYRSLLSNAGIQYETLKSPIGAQDHRFTIAAERWFPWLFVGNVGARGALTMGSRDFKQLTMGVSYRNPRFAVDYGFSMPLNSIVSIAGTHRLSFSIRLGPVQEAEESVELILEAMRRLKGAQAPGYEYRKEVLKAPEITAGTDPAQAQASPAKEVLKAPEITSETDPAQAQASLAVEEERYRDAIALSRQVLSRTPDNLPAWENLGISYFAVGEFPDSLDAFEKAWALEKNPARRSILNSHMNSVRNILKKPKTAAGPPVPSAGSAGAGASSQEVQNLYNEGLDLYSAGQLEKARAVFEQVLELNPRYAPAAKALKRVKEELKLK